MSSPSGSHAHRVLNLLAQKALLRPSDLDVLEIPRMVLTRMTAVGQLEKTARGLYRLPGSDITEHDSLITVATKVPQAVFCLLTALQFHGLTTQLPRQVWIAMPRGSHLPKIDHPPIHMIQVTGDVHSAGIEIVKTEATALRVYGVARTVVDCFKHRNKIGIDVALEALRDARSQKKASAEELWHYAKLCRVANVMRPYLEAIE